MTEQRADVYTRITDQIVAAIEAGAGKCRMPWHHDGQATSRPINLASNKPYRGINVLVLWAAADRCGYANGLWGTIANGSPWAHRSVRANAALSLCFGSRRATTMLIIKVRTAMIRTRAFSLAPSPCSMSRRSMVINLSRFHCALNQNASSTLMPSSPTVVSQPYLDAVKPIIARPLMSSVPRLHQWHRFEVVI